MPNTVEMNKFTLYCALLVSAAAVPSCKDDGPETTPEDPQKVPEVTISAVSSSLTEVSFTVTAKGADACSWMIAEKSSGSAPDAAAILKDGTPVGETPAVCEKGGLTPGTTYEIRAAASNAAGQSKVETAEITTKTEDKRLPSVEIRTGDSDESSIRFTLVFTDALEGAYMVLPEGSGIPDAAAILKDGTPADVSAAPEYTASELEAGQKYVIAAAASNADGTGEVASAEMETEAGPSLPGLETDVTNHQFGHVERMNYFGDIFEKGTGWYVIAVRDREPDADGNYPAGTAQLCFELHAALSESGAGMLPEGTYTVDAEVRPWTCVPGKIISAIPDGYQPDCTYFGLDGRYGMVESGTVTVAKNGDDYRISFDFRTADGHSVTAVYTGDLKAPGQAFDPNATTTLTGDYTIGFAPGDGTVANAYYYGYDESLSADVWSVYMEPKTKNMDSEAFMMDILTEPAASFAGVLPAGTAEAPDEYGVGYYGGPGHYVPGEYDEEGTMVHSWYMGGYVEIAPGDWRVTRYAAVKVGYIYIAKTGSDYTITIEYSDENWRTVTGTWTGPVTASDRSSASAAPRR